MNDRISNMTRKILLVSLLLVATWQELFFADAAPFPKFAFNIRGNMPQTQALTASSSVGTQVQTPRQISVQQHRGGAAAAVKTMTARQMEAFK